MSQHTGSYQRFSDGGGRRSDGAEPSQTDSTAATARDEAAGVGRSIEEGGEQVARTANQEAKDVTSETSRQARRLIDDGVGQLRDQARDGQHKAAVGMRGVADQLREMAKNAGQPGLASDVVQQASDQVHGAASWLERREPDELLDEVRGYVRRRPGTFLLGTAVAGVITGRLTRGAVDPRTASRSDGDGPPPHPPPHPPQAAPGSAAAEAPEAAHPGAGGRARGSGSTPRGKPAADADHGEPATWDPATDPPLDTRS